MAWALVIFLVTMASGAVSTGPPTPRLLRARVAALDVQDQPAYDPQAESDLLDLANRDRARAEAQPLQMNDCLTQAARRHAAAMAARQQLSHQFAGEADLAERFTDHCPLRFDAAAENVGLADSADRAHEGFMNSRMHRANLLYPAYDAVGIGVVRRGSAIYVVQDFAHVLPSYSNLSAGDAVGKGVERIRQQTGLAQLKRRDEGELQREACALAQRDSLQFVPAAHPQGVRYILRFTSMQPDDLPSSAGKALTDPNLHGFATGVCFARSNSYPGGAYWVVLRLY